MRCPACGEENGDGRKFCGECGAPLARMCSECGTASPPGVKFCGSTGAEVSV